MMIGFEFLERGFALALSVCIPASAMAQQTPAAAKATKSAKGSSEQAAAPVATTGVAGVGAVHTSATG